MRDERRTWQRFEPISQGIELQPIAGNDAISEAFFQNGLRIFRASESRAQPGDAFGKSIALHLDVVMMHLSKRTCLRLEAARKVAIARRRKG
jgi:hypothetical protein